MSARFRLALLLAAELLLLGAGSELAVRALALDRALLAKVVYRQMADVHVHRPSRERGLHYELRPGASAAYSFPAPRRVGVNALGYRGAERSARKPRGVFRILCFGGSNTYGAAVDDDQTYPARLERELNRSARGERYEVWNAGVSAYTLSQNAAAARLALARHEPDLLIFQHANRGRRAFLDKQDPWPFFEAEPSLFAENLAFPSRPGPFHARLMRGWRFYRACVLALNALLPHPRAMPREADAHNDSEFARLAADVAGTVPVFVFSHPGASLPPSVTRPAGRTLPHLELAGRLPPGAGPEYRDIHPPAAVYDWYARELAAALRREGLLPQRAGAKTAGRL